MTNRLHDWLDLFPIYAAAFGATMAALCIVNAVAVRWFA